jgi:hypothetical protein
VGTRTIARHACCTRQVVMKLKHGKASVIRTSTEAKILAVPVELAPGAHISAREARKQVAALQIEDFSKAEIARRLKRPGFRLKAHVTVATAAALDALHRDAVIDERRR